MLSKEEILENTKQLSLKEYSSLIMDSYLSKASREKCIELEKNNEMLKFELEKYKRIAVGTDDEKQIVISENYDQIINESDIVIDGEIEKYGKNTVDIEFEIKRIIDHIRTLPPNDELDDNVNYLFRTYHIDDDMNDCKFCSGKYRLKTSFPKVTFSFKDNKAIVIDEIFTGYKCDKCGAEITNSYEFAEKSFLPMNAPYISADSVVYMIIQKFVFNRSLKSQEIYWKKHNIEFSQALMCELVNEVCDRWIIPLYEKLKKELLRRELLCADVDGIRTYKLSENEMILHDNKMSDVFVYRTPENDAKPLVIIDVCNDYRFEDEPVNYEKPHDFLNNYDGIVHTEKIERFSFPKSKFKIAAMWSRAGKYLEDAQSHISPAYLDKSETAECLKAYNKMVKNEKENKDVDEDEVKLEMREMRSRRLTDTLTEYAAEFSEKHNNSDKKYSAVGKAYQFILDKIDELELYYTDPRVSVDNHLCESILEDFISGKYKFIRSDDYKRSVAVISVIRTAELNNLDPARYLTYYIKNSNKDLKNKNTMPWNCAEQCKEMFLHDFEPKNMHNEKRYEKKEQDDETEEND